MPESEAWKPSAIVGRAIVMITVSMAVRKMARQSATITRIVLLLLRLVSGADSSSALAVTGTIPSLGASTTAAEIGVYVLLPVCLAALSSDMGNPFF